MLPGDPLQLNAVTAHAESRFKSGIDFFESARFYSASWKTYSFLLRFRLFFFKLSATSKMNS